MGEYINACPKETRAILKRVRTIIKKVAPKAEESVSYGLAGYKLNGKPLVYFGGWKEHVGFYATPSGNIAFRKEIAKYRGDKGSIKFPLDEPIPYPLIRKMMIYRVKEEKAKQKAVKK